MRLITHQKLVNRNLWIGKYAFIAGMVLLVGALIVNFMALQPENQNMVVYAFAAFIVGFTLTNIGTYFNNRWGRRPDKGLADGLRGLDDRYTLYNYRLGASHVLVGPSGVHVLIPKYQPGPIAYEKGKWLNPGQPRGFLMGMFARDPLGNPSAEAAAEAESLTAFLKKRAPELGVAPQALIVFMNPRAEVSAKESPVPALHVKQLKEHLRRHPKGATISQTVQAELEAKLGLAPRRDEPQAT
jgi:hypothetical protein